LNVIPTSDVLGHRQAFYSYYLKGTERRIDERYRHAQGLQVGLFDRIEFGFDHDFAKDWAWNAKALLWESNDASQAVSFGALRLNQASADGYLAVRQDFEAGRLHAGVSSFKDGTLMFGWDMPLAEGSLMLDAATGANGSRTVGWFRPLLPEWGISASAAVIVPFRSGEPVNHYFSLAWQRAF
jgi:hypothetical protein